SRLHPARWRSTARLPHQWNVRIATRTRATAAWTQHRSSGAARRKLADELDPGSRNRRSDQHLCSEPALRERPTRYCRTVPSEGESGLEERNGEWQFLRECLP